MVTSPHQRIIKINREKVNYKDSKRPYMIAYTDLIEQASQDLSGAAFKVYIYMISNQDNYKFGCSPQDISNRYGLNVDTVKKSINKLIEKGYIVKTNGTYEFYEKPLVLDLEPVEKVKKKFRTKKGNVIELTYDELVDRVGQDKASIAWANAQ